MSLPELTARAQCAFDEVFQTRVGLSNVLLADVELSGGTRGGIIGGFFEYLFIKNLIDDTSAPVSPWRFGAQNSEPDLVYQNDTVYSLELKTSSQRNRVWGSPSKVLKSARTTKDGSGFYLVVNYDLDPRPELNLVRFGWLDDSDWSGNKSVATGSSKVIKEHADLKLVTLYTKD